LRTSYHQSQQENCGGIHGRRTKSVGLIHEDMNAEKEVLLQSRPQGYNIEKGLGYDDMIGCAKVVSVSISCSRCFSLVVFLLPPHVF